MSNRTNLNLNVDLQRGVVPISKAASSLAALIKRAHTSGQPVIVTQKGYPTGVLLPIELFSALKAMADGEDASRGSPRYRSRWRRSSTRSTRARPRPSRRRPRKAAAPPRSGASAQTRNRPTSVCRRHRRRK